MIVLKDIFKPRYAVVFQVITIPHLEMECGSLVSKPKYECAVVDLPYKRPLNVSFNRFYNELSKKGNVVAGSYWTLRRLYGIGSCLKHNMDNAIIWGEE